MTEAEARQRLAAAVPANVRDVCAKLAAAGHQAVSVGGAVRDALLGRDPGDWDVATSAHPDQVLALFRHTIPTGLQHGTVTVVTGKGVHTHVEITTYRGEGAYSDARRPDHVKFGVPLVEDLARRDFVINAMAYDIAKDELVDPFGGIADLAARRIRAVGSAVDRFTEDGLRVMRAVRFAAQLEFDLDPETEAGIAPALPSLAKVARERVQVELDKLLRARTPSRGLAIAQRTGIIASILPELDGHIDLGRVDRASVPTRLAAMFATLAPERAAELLRALKFANDDIKLAEQLVRAARVEKREWTAPDVRRLLAEIKRDKRALAIELWESEAAPDVQLIALAKQVIGDPLEPRDLAVTGTDVMAALDMKPGREVGRILALLLARVLEDPARNRRDLLLADAQTLELEIGHEDDDAD